MKDLHSLPDNLPVPKDDGACDHLLGSRFPAIPLESTSAKWVAPGELPGLVVAFFYPMTGRPESPPMLGWNDIPGARGCTPQTCSFRDQFSVLASLGATVFGISGQSLTDQEEARARLGLPFELLNDTAFALANAMNIPTFEYNNTTFVKRVTVIADNGEICKVFYPVFPPNTNVEDVIRWIRENKSHAS